MVAIKCELHVYDIKRCGLYQGRNKDAKHLNVKALMNDLKDWAINSGKPLIETSTYSESKRILESYCLGVSEYKGQYLLALWNRSPSSKLGVGLVNGSNAPDKVKITHAKVGAKDIPGNPSFFWVLPSSKKLVAIKLNNSSFGISQLREYMNAYLRGFCSYRVSRIEDGEEIEGYADFSAPTKDEDNRLVNAKLSPSFSISTTRVSGKQEEILDQSDDITKLVKDVFVHNNLVDENASLLEKISSHFAGLPVARKKKVRIQMPVSLMEEEVKELLKLFNDNDHSDEYDVGFIFKGQSSHIKWLSGSSKKEEIRLDVEWLAPDHPNIDKILISLQSHKHLISSSKLGDSSDEENN